MPRKLVQKFGVPETPEETGEKVRLGYEDEVVDATAWQVDCEITRLPRHKLPLALRGGDDRVAAFLTEEGLLRLRDRYYPEGAPELYREFAGLRFEEDEELRRFYGTYGPVGYPWRPGNTDANMQEPAGPRGYGKAADFGGEPICWLRQQSGELRLLIEVHHALQGKDTRRLRKLFGHIPAGTRLWDVQLDGTRTALWVAPADAFTSTRTVSFQEVIGQYTSESAIYPGARYVRETGRASKVSKRYLTRRNATAIPSQDAARCARELLTRHINLHLQGVRRVAHVPLEKRGCPRYPTAPFAAGWQWSTLLEAIYLQFFDLVTANGEMRRCPACGDLFPLTRRNRKYCSDSCSGRLRQRDYRKCHPDGGGPAPTRS